MYKRMNNVFGIFGWGPGAPVEPEPEPEPEKVDPIAKPSPVETTDCFKIVVVLDESGSMGSIKNEMIKSINSLIKEQKQIKDRPCKFTLVKFNDKVHRVIENLDLEEVKKLTSEDYQPDRTTALYDAIGNTVEWFRYEKDVLLVIVTDGQENASTKYRHKQITEMLDEKQRHRNWSYIYLCNDLSTSKQGESLGLKSCSYATNCVKSKGDFSSYLAKDVNQAISNYRTTGLSVQSQLNGPTKVKSRTESWGYV